MTDLAPTAKVGKSSYTDAGKMHLYLNYDREHCRKPGENPQLGLTLCADKTVLEYPTVLLDEKLLAKRLDKNRREFETSSLSSAADAEGAE